MASSTSSSQDWQSYDFDNQTIAEYKTLSQSERDKRFKNRLKFGTAGLRAPMGVGTNHMNSLTVLQTTQGLCKYLIEKHNINVESIGKDNNNIPSIVIGYDGRYNSKKFAHVAGSVFISQKFKVYLFSVETPTPLTPFMVQYYKCLSGIQITASHNPKADNGYKLYGESGAQIIPPMDHDIEKMIETCLKPWNEAISLLDISDINGDIKLKDFEKVCNDPMNLFESSTSSSSSSEEIYLDMMMKELSYNHNTSEKTNNLTVVPKFKYTAMHGVGWDLLSKLWVKFKLPLESLIPVESQKLPDPEFPTVVFPNPEEKGALNMAIQEANEAGDIDYVLANDPDADRFTAAEKYPSPSSTSSGSTSEWKLFSGDELGILFADWQYKQFIKKYKKESENASEENASDDITGLFITSVVSSRMLSKFASMRKGCEYKDTLTGFKYMSNESISIQNQHPNKYLHLLAYEEAIGYQLSGNVPDKDGVSAACVFADMVRYYRNLDGGGKFISEHLTELQNELGLYITNNGYFKCNDPKLIEQIFNEFRNNSYQLNFNDEKSCSIESMKCLDVNDVTLGIGSKQLGPTPDAQMIQFTLNNVIVTLRASGTEPKLKYYTEYQVIDQGGANSSKEELELNGRKVLSDVVDVLIKGFFQPEKFDLKRG